MTAEQFGEGRDQEAEQDCAEARRQAHDGAQQGHAARSATQPVMGVQRYTARERGSRVTGWLFDPGGSVGRQFTSWYDINEPVGDVSLSALPGPIRDLAPLLLVLG